MSNVPINIYRTVVRRNSGRTSNPPALDGVNPDPVNPEGTISGGSGPDSNKVSYNQADNRSLSERSQARENIELLRIAGYEWTSRNASEQNSWSSVTYGKGLFVAIASSGTNRIMISNNGVNWVPIASPEQNSWASITYGKGLFVAIASSVTNRIMISNNGVNWVPVNLPQVSFWASVTYGDGLFVAVSQTGTNRVATSPDGITWTLRNASEQNSWQSVTYGNRIFVAVAASGNNRVMTSPDGITWTARLAATQNSWLNVSYGNGLFVAVSATGDNRVMTSLDGINWVSPIIPVTSSWTSVSYGKGLYVIVARFGDNRVITSQDGITWTSRNASQQNQWSSVTYGNGLFVAVSAGGTSRVMTSGWIIDVRIENIISVNPDDLLENPTIPAPITLPVRDFISGDYGFSNTVGGTVAFNNGRVYYIPITHIMFAKYDVNLTEISIQVTAAGAGTTIRLGVYELVDNNVLNLVIDGGTVDSSTTGVKSLAITPTVLTRQKIYYFAIKRNDGDTVVQPTLASSNNFTYWTEFLFAPIPANMNQNNRSLLKFNMGTGPLLSVDSLPVNSFDLQQPRIQFKLAKI